MKFRKPKKEDFDTYADVMLCWRFWKIDVWYDLNFMQYYIVLREMRLDITPFHWYKWKLKDLINKIKGVCN